VIVFYTDGLVESVNAENERYPMQDMEKILQGSRRKSAKTVSTSIIDSLKKFTGTVPQGDDITVLVVKIL
jgi:serine phosphatase RsbU (regulator of sigma subunit)